MLQYSMNKFYRIMALDLGDVRIGVAISDPMGIIASGLETYSRKNLKDDILHIKDLIEERQVNTVVLGLPLNMDGTKGERVEKTYAFAEELKKVVDCKMEFIDERLTTVSAERILISGDVRRDKRKQVIDKIAATIILQSYLDKK